MILVLTNTQDVTADFLTKKLVDAGLQLLRLDTDNLVSQLKIGYRDGCPELEYEDCVLTPELVSVVWYRRPERLQIPSLKDCDEGKFVINEWTEALEGFLSHIPLRKWMNHPSRNAIASNKLEQLSFAKSLDLITPATVMTTDLNELRSFWESYSGNVIVKPLSNGYIDKEEGDDTLIYTCKVNKEHFVGNREGNCPTLFQELIRKQSDVRITLVDDDMHAVAICAEDSSGEQRCDIRRNNMQDVRYVETGVPEQIAMRLRQLVSNYGLRFAAIDMVVDVNDQWIFLEVNPNGQWAWLDITGGLNISDSFINSFSHVSE